MEQIMKTINFLKSCNNKEPLYHCRNIRIGKATKDQINRNPFSVFFDYYKRSYNYFFFPSSWLARTNPADTARVESKTFISTDNRSETIPTPKEGIKGVLGNWISPSDMDTAIKERFTGCMKGRTMYIIPFSMGPIASPLSKIGKSDHLFYKFHYHQWFFALFYSSSRCFFKKY